MVIYLYKKYLHICLFVFKNKLGINLCVQYFLGRWLSKCAKRGFPAHKKDLLNSVQKLMVKSGRRNPFTNNRPGKWWLTGFLRRYPHVEIASSGRLTKSRVGLSETRVGLTETRVELTESRVGRTESDDDDERTEEYIRSWFNDLKAYMKELGCSNIFDNPSKIFNCVENSLKFCPKSKKVIGFTNWKNVFLTDRMDPTSGCKKSDISFLGTFAADGKMITPMVIYPYPRLPYDVVETVPEEMYISGSNRKCRFPGDTTSDTFLEFLLQVFNPWLEKNEVLKPVIMFVDLDNIHVSIRASELSEQLKIYLYRVPFNTALILQPANIGPFKKLPSYWKEEVENFNRENPNRDVCRAQVAPLLHNVLKKVEKSSILSGFRVAGLSPLNPENVNYTTCLDVPNESSDRRPNLCKRRQAAAGEFHNVEKFSSDEYITALRVVEQVMGPVLVQKCRDGIADRDMMDVYQKLRRRAFSLEIDPVLSPDVIDEAVISPTLMSGSLTLLEKSISNTSDVEIDKNTIVEAVISPTCIPESLASLPKSESNTSDVEIDTKTIVEAVLSTEESQTYNPGSLCPLQKFEFDESDIEIHKHMTVETVISTEKNPTCTESFCSLDKSESDMNDLEIKNTVEEVLFSTDEIPEYISESICSFPDFELDMKDVEILNISTVISELPTPEITNEFHSNPVDAKGGVDSHQEFSADESAFLHILRQSASF